MTVFISYRRSDSAGWTGRLYDRLAVKLGQNSVFYDIGSLAAGEDFVAAINERLRICNVVLVIIGPNWLTARAPDGTRRLDQSDDHVRREIELALERGVRLIPVLVGGAGMPTARDLPPSIAGLSSRNALQVSDFDFDHGVDKLGQAIQDARPSSSIDLKEILGEERGAEQYCKGFQAGATEMLMELKYGGANFPECVVPNNVPFLNIIEATCRGFRDGVALAARQQDQNLSDFELDRRYDRCVAERMWETCR